MINLRNDDEAYLALTVQTGISIAMQQFYSFDRGTYGLYLLEASEPSDFGLFTYNQKNYLVVYEDIMENDSRLFFAFYPSYDEFYWKQIEDFHKIPDDESPVIVVKSGYDLFVMSAK